MIDLENCSCYRRHALIDIESRLRLSHKDYVLTIVCFVFRVEPTQLAFIILGASMAALALMILVVAILATGNTRHEVYKSSFGRTGGTIGNHLIYIIHNFIVV